MTQRFTKELRQEIAREFARQHNGQFDAGLFVKEVRETGASHPAYDWFPWDKDAVFDRYQLERAREFVRDLRVTFRVEEVTAPHSVRVRETPMPMVLSPLNTRSRGGGYVLVDPDDPAFIEEHCRQAARALSEWQDRYAAAIIHAKVKKTDVEIMVGKLERATARRAPALTSPQAEKRA